MSNAIPDPIDCQTPADERDAMVQRSALALLVLAGGALAVAPASAQADRPPFSPEELDQMLAPIALYPDAVLSQIMMAATYPLEVVEAARWSQTNPNVKGDAAIAAVQQMRWDASVKSLVAFPPVLAQMNDQLQWTQNLGDAMISQEADVADSIQRLRARASDAGNLKTGKEQVVSTQAQGSDRIIVIEPADPQVVYVPSYNPTWVYGSWPYPAYPPYYWPLGGALATGFLWGLGFAAAGALFGGWAWGYGRGSSYVNVNVNRATNIDRNFDRTKVGSGNRWQHNVDHRRGVAYRDTAARDRYGQSRPGVDHRQQFRGQDGGGPRPGEGAGQQRPGGEGAGGPAQRPSGGGAPSQRPGAAQRPSGGGAGPAQRPSGGLDGVDRGQQVNREAQRGRAQQSRAGSHGGGGARPSGGGARAGGGGARGGGGGGRR
ncbi:MAG: DUF3300 domain-containing protein [Enhydrobacter sp.]|nr:MAG: DUF3300 domain-containing protein [Enhydrobacter sp.]